MRFALLQAALNDTQNNTAQKILRAVNQWVAAPLRSRKEPAYYTVDFDGKHYASNRCQLDMLQHKKGF